MGFSAGLVWLPGLSASVLNIFAANFHLREHGDVSRTVPVPGFCLIACFCGLTHDNVERSAGFWFSFCTRGARCVGCKAMVWTTGCDMHVPVHVGMHKFLYVCSCLHLYAGACEWRFYSVSVLFIRVFQLKCMLLLCIVVFLIRMCIRVLCPRWVLVLCIFNCMGVMVSARLRTSPSASCWNLGPRPDCCLW